MTDRPVQRLLTFLPNLRLSGVALLLAVVFTLFAYHYMQDTTCFNSDHLYCIHFCDDVLHGRDVQGWHLPAAPYLFPDMVLVLGSMALTSNLAAGFTLYQAFYYGLLLIALIAILRNAYFSWRGAFLLGGLGLSFLLAAHLHPAYVNRSLPMFHPGNHMGCLLVGLAVLAYVLFAMRKGFGWFSAALFVAVCTLGGFSDQLLIVQFFAPISMAVLALAICRQFPFLRSLTTTILLGVSTFLAMHLRWLVVKLGLVPMNILTNQTDPPRDFKDCLLQFGNNVWDIVHDQPIMCVVFVLNFLGAFTVLLIYLRRSLLATAPTVQAAEAAVMPANGSPENRPALLLLTLYFLLAPCCNAGAMLVTGTVKEAALLRYLHTWWLLPYLCLLVWAYLLPWRIARVAPWTVLAIIACRLLTFSDPLQADRFTSRYPPLAQKLDELVRKHGRLRGVAEYWRSRETRYLTQEHVSVVPILTPGMPWFHGFNPNAYLADDPNDLTIPDYHFVIFSPDGEGGPNPEQIVARYGNPVETIAAGEYEIWRYERMVSRQFDLFLRAQLAQRLVRHKPFLGPVHPPTLSMPKRNLTAWDDPRNVLLESNASLIIRFDKPVTGAMIDLSAHYSDEYSLVFIRDGRELGTVRVPGVQWTGAESAYCRAGLQSRLVPVPPACRSEGFNEARLIPLGRSQHFSVGHFLVFDDWIPYQSGEGRQLERYHRYEGEKLNRLESAEVATIEESSASNGQCRQATASYQGCMAYGPYTLLAPGRYRVDFALKVADNTSSEVVAMIDSCAFGGEQSLQMRSLRGTDFSKANQYQIFSFTFNAEDELDLVEFRAIVPGKTAVTLDYVDVTRLTPEKTSEACEP